MSILILDENPDYTRVLGDVLTSMGFAVRSRTDPRELVSTLGDRDLIIAAPAAGLDPLDHLMRELRRDAGRMYTPVIILADERTRRNPELEAIVARFRNGRLVRRETSLLDLGEQVRQMQDRPRGEARPAAAPETNEVVRTMFQLFGAIWCQEESGMLTASDGRFGWINKGSVPDVATLDLVEGCLDGRITARFERRAASNVGDSSTLGRALWNSAARHADPAFAQARLDLALQPVTWADRIQDLPVHEDIPRLISTANGVTPLRSQTAALRIDPARVGRDLSMLALLGLAKFGNTAKPETRAPTPRPPQDNPFRQPTNPPPDTPRGRPAQDNPFRQPTNPPPDTPRSRPAQDNPFRQPTNPPPDSPRPRPESGSTPRPTNLHGSTPQASESTDGLLQLKRLRKEVQRLSESDAWTVLGLAPTQDADQVKAAAQRLRERYEKLAKERSDSDEVGRLCASLVRQIGDAESRALRRIGQTIEAATLNDEERFFLAGKEAAADGRWSIAVRAFRAAHKVRIDEPLYQVWLGWALFNDTTRGEPRIAESLEMLELADHFNGNIPEGQLFLARVETQAGKAERAVQRLERLSKREASLPGIDQALRLARDKLAERQEGKK